MQIQCHIYALMQVMVIGNLMARDPYRNVQCQNLCHLYFRFYIIKKSTQWNTNLHCTSYCLLLTVCPHASILDCVYIRDTFYAQATLVLLYSRVVFMQRSLLCFMSALTFWRSKAITSPDDMHNTRRFTVLDLVSGTFSKYLYLGHVRAIAIVKPGYWMRR